MNETLDIHQKYSINSHLLCVFVRSVSQVCLFLKRGGKQNTVDVDGRSPLSIAVEAANADIVTLYVRPRNSLPLPFVRFPFKLSLFLSVRLRLAKMNEEMKGTEGAFGQSGQYSHSQSHTEQQYKKCIQEFITSQLQES